MRASEVFAQDGWQVYEQVAQLVQQAAVVGGEVRLSSQRPWATQLPVQAGGGWGRRCWSWGAGGGGDGGRFVVRSGLLVV